MATVDVLDWTKKKVGSIDLDSEIFEAPIRKEILHDIVRWQLAKKRQGNHCAKTRAEVTGSSKKPFKQKGTGNARQGTNKSPLKPGGGITFGPKPRDYDYNIPKKVKRLALRSALSYLFKEGKLQVVESMKSEGKTNELNKRLQDFGLKKSVLVDAVMDPSFKRASSNLKAFTYMPAQGLNVFDLLKFDNVIITKDAVEKIETRCGVN